MTHIKPGVIQLSIRFNYVNQFWVCFDHNVRNLVDILISDTGYEPDSSSKFHHGVIVRYPFFDEFNLCSFIYPKWEPGFQSPTDYRVTQVERNTTVRHFITPQLNEFSE